MRVNKLTGGMAILDEGWALDLPIVHEVRTFRSTIRSTAPRTARKASGAGASESVEGLFDRRRRLRARWGARSVEDDAGRAAVSTTSTRLCSSTVDGALHRAFAQHMVREISR